jgi:predicted transglutaminase-like cysteine proteinase
LQKYNSRQFRISWLLWKRHLRGAMFICMFMLGLLCFAEIAANKLESTMQKRFGTKGLIKLQAWETLIENNKTNSTAEKNKAVNDFFNKNTRFEDDIIHWKATDYWATPLETLGSEAGDCEDYTIAKYFSLIRLGVHAENLRLIYVKAQIGGPSSRVFQAHMVLGYYEQPNSIPLILDSLISDIQTADKRTDLHPVFSFNSEGLWVGGQAQPQIDPTARLSRWRDVLERMKQEGF